MTNTTYSITHDFGEDGATMTSKLVQDNYVFECVTSFYDDENNEVEADDVIALAEETLIRMADKAAKRRKPARKTLLSIGGYDVLVSRDKSLDSSKGVLQLGQKTVFTHLNEDGTWDGKSVNFGETKDSNVFTLSGSGAKSRFSFFVRKN